jgi:predicted aldo/keto reductase-like oxidoreductase
MSDVIAYTRLGRTGLKVSRLCLGTMNFGPQTGEAESFGIMDRALELGINFFDTAAFDKSCYYVLYRSAHFGMPKIIEK